jgi:NifU-like protein involved in Fe-S cluster formation
MDEAVIAYYRRLLKEEFPNAGELSEPSAFVEAVGGRLINCGNTGNYMQLYLRVADGRITDISYQCACEPVANVAVEILCTLARGMTLDEAVGLTEEPFSQFLGSRGEELNKKAVGLLALLKEGISSCQTLPGARMPSADDGEARDGKISWDEALSS